MRDALLRAVLADPADDLARLAYADWLAEHGGEADRLHAEFVQVQVALHHREPGYSLDTRRSWEAHAGSANPLIRRAARLLRKWWYAAGRLDLWFPGDYSRGFLREVTVEAPAYERHAGTLFRLHPAVGRVLVPGQIQCVPDAKEPWMICDRCPLHPWEFPRWGFRNEWFSTREDAERHLSGVLVRWGRAQSGLGLWPEEGG